jgi:hypothetical protein
MNYENILKALFAYLDGVAGLPAIYWPNVSETTPSGDHLVAWVLPAESDTIGLASLNMANGLLQIDVKIKATKGQIKAAVIVDDVIAAFPRGTELTEGVTKVRIDKAASVSQGIQDGAWYTVPIRIPFYSIF